MRILALDPGAKNIGWSLLDVTENGTLKLKGYALLTTESIEEAFHDKMNEEMQVVLEHFALVHEHHEPTHCAWELPPTFGQYGNRDRVVSALSVFKTLAWEHNCLFAGLTPRVVKEKFTGDSKASKADMKAKALEMFPQLEDDLQPDVYDAIAVGVVAHQRDQWKERWWTRKK